MTYVGLLPVSKAREMSPELVHEVIA